jgi:hypothetical protein
MLNLKSHYFYLASYFPKSGIHRAPFFVPNVVSATSPFWGTPSSVALNLMNMLALHVHHSPGMPPSRAQAEAIYFDDATFSVYANFKKATFDGYSSFLATTFVGEANFESTTFSSSTAFKGAVFCEHAYFYRATFSGDIDFTAAAFRDRTDFRRALFKRKNSFENAQLKGDTSFQGAVFEFEPLIILGTQLHQSTVLHGIIWPPSPKDEELATRFVGAYETLKLEMDRLKRHEDELFLFGREMEDRRILYGDWKVLSNLRLCGHVLSISPLKLPLLQFAFAAHKLLGWTFRFPFARLRIVRIPLYRPAAGMPIAIYGLLCEYGRSYMRPLVGLCLTAAVGALLAWPHFGLFKYTKAIGFSLANTLAILGFRKDFFGPNTVATLSNLLVAMSASQSVLGALFLFLFGLALRNRFRMR